MHYALTVTVPPASEPVTLTEAKAQLRVDSTADDTLITSLITAARLYCEKATGLAIAAATYEAAYDAFPGNSINLPRSPASAVSSVTYYDANNALQTLAASYYVVDIKSVPARIELAYGQSWPTTYTRPGAVLVTFTAGYATCPADLKQAVLLEVQRQYEGPTDELTFARDAILSTYKVWL